MKKKAEVALEQESSPAEMVREASVPAVQNMSVEELEALHNALVALEQHPLADHPPQQHRDDLRQALTEAVAHVVANLQGDVVVSLKELQVVQKWFARPGFLPKKLMKFGAIVQTEIHEREFARKVKPTRDTSTTLVGALESEEGENEAQEAHQEHAKAHARKADKAVKSVEGQRGTAIPVNQVPRHPSAQTAGDAEMVADMVDDVQDAEQDISPQRHLGERIRQGMVALQARGVVILGSSQTPVDDLPVGDLSALRDLSALTGQFLKDAEAIAFANGTTGRLSGTPFTLKEMKRIHGYALTARQKLAATETLDDPRDVPPARAAQGISASPSPRSATSLSAELHALLNPKYQPINRLVGGVESPTVQRLVVYFQKVQALSDAMLAMAPKGWANAKTPPNTVIPGTLFTVQQLRELSAHAAESLAPLGTAEKEAIALVQNEHPALRKMAPVDLMALKNAVLFLKAHHKASYPDLGYLNFLSQRIAKTEKSFAAQGAEALTYLNGLKGNNLKSVDVGQATELLERIALALTVATKPEALDALKQLCGHLTTTLNRLEAKGKSAEKAAANAKLFVKKAAKKAREAQVDRPKILRSIPIAAALQSLAQAKHVESLKPVVVTPTSAPQTPDPDMTTLSRFVDDALAEVRELMADGGKNELINVEEAINIVAIARLKATTPNDLLMLKKMGAAALNAAKNREEDFRIEAMASYWAEATPIKGGPRKDPEQSRVDVEYAVNVVAQAQALVDELDADLAQA